MKLVDHVTYDRTTGVLTARYHTPSLSRWALYEYRDVAPETFDAVRVAGPSRGLVIAREVAPTHAWRRVGSGAWNAPGSTEHAGPEEALDPVGPRRG